MSLLKPGRALVCKFHTGSYTLALRGRGMWLKGKFLRGNAFLCIVFHPWYKISINRDETSGLSVLHYLVCSVQHRFMTYILLQ